MLLSADTVHYTVQTTTLSRATDAAAHSLLSRLEKDVISDHATFLNYALLTRCKGTQICLPVPAVHNILAIVQCKGRRLPTAGGCTLLC